MEYIKKYKSLILLFLVVFLALILRFYKLGDIPYGFYQDETSIGYNAYSILETGRDEYGKNFPLYFKSFGDYKLPIYVYSTAISIKAFGLTEFAVRFPSAFFGTLSVIALYLFVKELTKNGSIALVSSLLYSINPWSLHYNRATFEVSISLFLFLLGGYLLTKAFNQKKGFVFILGTLFFATALYTYNLTRLLAPLLFLIFVLWNHKNVTNLGKKYLVIAFLLSVFILLPFSLSFFREGGIGSASGTLIFSSAVVQAPHLEFRSYILDFNPLLSKVFFNNYVFSIIEFTKNILQYFDFNFFFVSGATHGNHGIGNTGQFYLFEVFTIFIGLITLLGKKTKWIFLLLLWSAAVITVAALTREAPHATRSFFLIPPFIVISASGLLFLKDYLWKLKNSYAKFLFFSMFSVFVLLNLVYYFTSYYLYFPSAYAKSWRSTDRDLSLYIKEIEKNYDKIIFDNKAGFIYSSLLFYFPYDPLAFQNGAIRLPDDSEGFSKIRSFGKYEFKDIDWVRDMDQNQKVLIVSLRELVPDNITIDKHFYFPRRHIVVPQGQVIIQYPVVEESYVVIKNR